MESSVFLFAKFLAADFGMTSIFVIFCRDFHVRKSLMSGGNVWQAILNRKPFTCPLCMGFWNGLLLSPLMLHADKFQTLCNAFIGAGTCWILNRAVTGEY